MNLIISFKEYSYQEDLCHQDKVTITESRYREVTIGAPTKLDTVGILTLMIQVSAEVKDTQDSIKKMPFVTLVGTKKKSTLFGGADLKSIKTSSQK